MAVHMPFGGAADDLAAAIGAFITKGYATDDTCAADEFLFSRANGLLADHPITRGRNATERVTEVRTFTGEAFRVTAPGGAPPGAAGGGSPRVPCRTPGSGSASSR